MITMKKYLPAVLLLLAFAWHPLQAEEELLEPDKAFPFEVTVKDDTLQADWNIPKGYYLYRSKIRFSTDTPGISLGEPQLPAGKLKQDEFFGEIEIYQHPVTAQIPIVRENPEVTDFELKAVYQGCADIGVCYPPITKIVQLSLPAKSGGAIAALGALSESLGFGGGGEDEVLEPDQAFQFSMDVIDPNTLMAYWQIAPDHYMYRGKISFDLADGQTVQLGQAQLPAGEKKHDEFFGDIEVYHDQVEARIPLIRTNLEPTTIQLTTTYQGCAEKTGICYPPIKKTLTLALPATTSLAAAETVSPAIAIQTEVISEQDQIAASLASGNTLLIILTFFGFGLLLAFTPCVFPMIPILSSIIVGQGESITTRKAFFMSLTYVLAMALTYTVAGVIAGWFGENLQAAFQNPWVLGSFAAIFVALSLSMFGFYELQMPSALQSRLTEISNRQQGGTLVGVAIMGFLSALIVGPCVAAPLAGALIYIGQTGDAVLGGAALFALSLGMGAPLIAIGTSAGKLLPRAGGWMDAIKAVFGVLLLAVAIWMLERVIPPAVTMLLWAILLIVSAIYMKALDSLSADSSGWQKLWKGVGVVLLVLGTLQLIGAAAGGRDYLQPLKGLQLGVGSGGVSSEQHLAFKRIKSVDDLQGELAKASKQGKLVMLDFYADWCVYCKDYEKYVFTDPRVQQALSNVVLLQADVTANDELDKVLLKHVNVTAPPAILFFDTHSTEMRGYRLVGSMDADEFLAHVNQVIQP
jgi:thiol:disulfide interchange protein DsbD